MTTRTSNYLRATHSLPRRINPDFLAFPRNPSPHSHPSHSRTQQRYFHKSSSFRAEDHYATLELQPGASASEIKKSFYKLSKVHHPDHNPGRHAEASKKFMAVSEAYHTLGDQKKREQYDRERQPPQSAGRSSYSSERGGSGFSAGGRKASGLSRRKGTFRGPPPSFYRSGGWGDTDEKRRANAHADPREAEAKRRAYQTEQSTSGPYGGKTGAWPFATDPNDVGHFDREGHFKTHSTVEEQLNKGRRQRRGAFTDDTVGDEGGGQMAIRFFQVCGLLAIGLGLPVMIFRG